MTIYNRNYVIEVIDISIEKKEKLSVFLLKYLSLLSNGDLSLTFYFSFSNGFLSLRFTYLLTTFLLSSLFKRTLLNFSAEGKVKL